MGRFHRSKGWFVLVVGLAATLAPIDAHGQNGETENRYLAKARKAYDRLQYGRVLPLLRKALRTAKSPTEEIQVFFLQGTMHTIYSRDEKARESFREILRRDPNFELPPNTSPKIRAVFADARQDAPEPIEPDTSADFANPSGDSAPDGGEASPALAPPPPPPSPTGEANTSDPDVPPPADDASAGPLTATSPMMPGVTTHSLSTPFYEEWWFWTVVGGVVLAGGAVLTWQLLRPKVPEHDFGPVPIR